MNRRPGRGGQVAAACWLLLLALLAGCAGLPTDSAVHTEQLSGSSDEVDQPIRVLPPPPSKGEGPEQIVHGFLRAQGNADDHHAIARRYLAPGTRWDDSTYVGVYDPVDLHVGDAAGGQVVVQAALQARIDRSGAYSLAQGEVVRDTYTLSRVGQAWRLSAVPDGLLLTAADVGRLYQPQNVYFLAPPNLDVLVPDRRFLPAAPKALVGTLVRALAAGPSGWLAPAVATAIPSGWLRGVSVQGGVATVDLGPSAAQASPQDRARMSAQLIWTLKQTDVRGLRLLAGSRPLLVGGSARVQTLDQWTSYDPDVVNAAGPAYAVPAYYAADDQLEVVSERGTPNSVGQVAGLEGRPLGAPAVSLEGSQLAGLARRADGGTDLLVGALGHRVSLRASAASFTPPSWGSGVRGVWTVGGQPDGTNQRVLLTPAGQGEPVAIDAPGLAGVGPVHSFRVSRDGTRVAVIAGSEQPGMPPLRLYLGRLVAGGGTTAVQALVSIAPTLRKPIDVAWASADTLVVLASRSGSALPWLVTLDGSSVSPVTTGGLPGPPVVVAAAPGRPLVVEAIDNDGHPLVYQSGGGTYSLVGSGRDPTYPG